MKKISVALLPQLLPANWANEKTLAIVIDTLRFTSTACVALQAGAEEIHVVAEVENARQLAENLRATASPLLCGERHCHPIEGFDLGNSPFEYTQQRVAGKALIFSTTNGTRAVESALPASQIVLGSLLNRSAVANHVITGDCDNIWIVCAGTDGQVAFEDVLTAGAILAVLNQHVAFANDGALIANHLFSSMNQQHSAGVTTEIIRAVSIAAGGSNLIHAGYDRDIQAVVALDTIDLVPRNSSMALNVFR